MDTDTLIVYIKSDNVYKDVAKDIEGRFDTSDYELNRPLPKGKNRKVIGIRKDELHGRIVRLRAKIHSY